MYCRHAVIPPVMPSTHRRLHLPAHLRVCMPARRRGHTHGRLRLLLNGAALIAAAALMLPAQAPAQSQSHTQSQTNTQTTSQPRAAHAPTPSADTQTRADGQATTSADQAVVRQLLDAIAKRDHKAFISQGTPAFAQLSESQFNQVASAIAPRLAQGYTVEHLGNLRQQGLEISVWKISFTDQSDDLLATLNVTGGQVGGFFLR